MADLVTGILLVLVGALFCFRGYLAMRIIIPIWGGLAGFFLGASIVAGAGNVGFLRTTVGWLVGLAIGVLFMALAYLYYEICVSIGMGAIGFVLGVSVMTAVGVTWNWLIVLIGLSVGILLAVAAIASDLPTTLLTVLTATSGASTIVTGVLLMVGKINSSDFTENTNPVKQGHHEWWGYAIWGGLVVTGIIAQVTATDRVRGTMREAWETTAPGYHATT
jgi:hypothetical protein